MEKKEKTRASTLKKKHHILKVALECFIEYGVEATTIDMIREASGMSVGSLYHHFGNKEKIAAAVFIQGMYEFGELTRRYLDNIKCTDSSAEAGVKALVFANVDWISDNPDWARYVFQHRSLVAKADAEDKLRADINRFYKDLVEWFTPYIKSNVVKPLSVDLFSSLIAGPTHDYARHWLAGRYKAPISEHRSALAEAAWDAVKNQD